MRDHQKAGVKFMFECVTGLKDRAYTGCILADTMGLGKTFQCITLMWTLMKQNPFKKARPFVKKVIICAPLTLLKNWDREMRKWLGYTRV